MKRMVFGFLGTEKDSPDRRGNSFRPTVSLFMHQDFRIDEFHLIYDNQFLNIAQAVLADIAQASPKTKITTHIIEFADPWDFEEVYEKTFALCKSFEFDSDKNEYFFHISTGTHVAKICIFLLAETRYFPGKLLQSIPGPKSKPDTAGYSVVDLDISRYDLIANRFKKEADNAIVFLKSGIDTKNKKFNRLIEDIEQVAIKSPEPILLMGATGTGKSRLARRIYDLKKQRLDLKGDFVELNCGTLRGDAAMSALFGHAKGAYTGADSKRKGFLLQADKGLLFLDEIGELGLDEQTLLLKAIEDKKFFPYGSDEEISSDFQLICGTNRDLLQAVRQGKFREDLLARINLWTFSLPNLKERPEDIHPNIEYELEVREKNTGSHCTFNKEAMAQYLSFAQSSQALWTANFRDLNGSIERMCTLAVGARITPRDVAGEIERLKASWGVAENTSATDTLLFPDMDEFDRMQLAGVLRVCRECSTLAEAGRRLYAKSRLRKQGKKNDTDRLKKYLERFGFSWKSAHDGVSVNG